MIMRPGALVLAAFLGVAPELSAQALPRQAMAAVIQAVRTDSLIGLRGVHRDSILVDLVDVPGITDSMAAALARDTHARIAIDPQHRCRKEIDSNGMAGRATCALKTAQAYVEINEVKGGDGAGEAIVVVARRSAAGRKRGFWRSTGAAAGRLVGRHPAERVTLSFTTYRATLGRDSTGAWVVRGIAPRTGGR